MVTRWVAGDYATVMPPGGHHLVVTSRDAVGRSGHDADGSLAVTGDWRDHGAGGCLVMVTRWMEGDNSCGGDMVGDGW